MNKPLLPIGSRLDPYGTVVAISFKQDQGRVYYLEADNHKQIACIPARVIERQACARDSRVIETAAATINLSTR